MYHYFSLSREMINICFSFPFEINQRFGYSFPCSTSVVRLSCSALIYIIEERACICIYYIWCVDLSLLPKVNHLIMIIKNSGRCHHVGV